MRAAFAATQRGKSIRRKPAPPPSRIRALTRNAESSFSFTPRFSEVKGTLHIGTSRFNGLPMRFSISRRDIIKIVIWEVIALIFFTFFAIVRHYDLWL